MTLNDIMKALYFKKEAFFVDMFGKIKHNQTTLYGDRYNCVSEKHIERWLYINDLLNVSAFLNEGWCPDWKDKAQAKFIICLQEKRIHVSEIEQPLSFTYFKSKEIAEKAIEIMGVKALEAIFMG